MKGKVDLDFRALIGPVAQRLLGSPNKALSSANELRYGTHGSLSIHVNGDVAGTWHDHEAGNGGGVLDLVVRERGGNRREAAQWLHDEFGDERGLGRQRSTIVATYPYRDEWGSLIHEVVRFEPKEFRQRRPDGSGGFTWNMKGVPPLIYRLPEIVQAMCAGEWIFVVEGEKDADNLARAGIAATCNAGGAGKWRAEHAAQLAGARVAILPDHDEAGRDHGQMVARSLIGLCSEIRVVDLGLVDRKSDVSDFLSGGGTAAAILDRVAVTPAWRPEFRPTFPFVWFGDEDSRPAMSWLVKGLIVSNGLALVYGAPKSSKTFLVLDIALHVAHGRAWRGMPVQRSGVIYVCGEGEAGVRLRMKAWRQEKGGETGAPFALVPQAVNLFDGEEEVDRLIRDILAAAELMSEPPRLIIFDTFSRMIGGGDEDRAPDQNVMVARARRIQDATGAAVLYVHHAGKDAARGARGSNALPGAADVVLQVTKNEETGLCEGKVTMMKDGAEPAPFTYMLRQSTVGTDDEGDDIVSCVIDLAGASQGATRGTKLTDLEKFALDQFDAVARDIGTDGDNRPNVPLGTWRDRIYSSGDGTHEAKRKRSQRGPKALEDRGIVIIEGGVAYLQRRP